MQSVLNCQILHTSDPFYLLSYLLVTVSQPSSAVYMLSVLLFLCC